MYTFLNIVIVCWLLIINIVTFFAYFLDKKKAIAHTWRIPEATLLGLTAIGGSLGAFLGMEVLRHKTKHLIFIVGVRLFLAIHVALLFCLYIYPGWITG